MRAYRRAAAISGAVSQLPPALRESSCVSSQSTLSRPATGNLRAAFVVPKKLGPATFRNHLRRRMSEAFSHVQKSAGSEPPFRDFLANYDLIFLATPAASNASFAQIGEAFSHLMRRLGADKARGSAWRPGSVSPGSVSKTLRGEAGNCQPTSLPAPVKRQTDAGTGIIGACREVP